MRRIQVLGHLHELNGDLLILQPIGFAFEVCDRATRPDRQDRLVLEYEPRCNRDWPRLR